MKMTSDLELLERYAQQSSEEAFAALVNRHLDLVYSAALRQLRSPQLAEEVSQSVFADLARNAGKLKANTVLTAWLYQVTRRTAIDVVRRESRRQFRERIALEMTEMNSTTSEWTQIEPLLDDAMEALDDTERAAVLLRYFENKSLREVGQTLGTSEDAAQKRVSRAVERLREFFSKRGVAVGASGLVLVISANAVQAAPAALAAVISSAALAATTSGATFPLLKLMLTSKFKVGAVSTVVLASAVTSVVIQQQSHARLRDANQALHQQADQLAERRADNARLSQLVALSSRAPANNEEELQRLQTEVAALRKQTKGLADLQDQARQLKASLNQVRRDPSVAPTVRSEQVRAKVDYSLQLGLAAMKYASEHHQQFPSNLADAADYFSEAALKQTNLTAEQFEIVYTGARDALSKYAQPGRILLIRERQPWKNTDGQWVKTYVFSDGSASFVSVTDGNFETWEEQHMVRSEQSNP